MNPPDGQYRKDYAGERVLTVDGKPLVDGLRVFTNNLDTGTVDLSRAEFEWHAGEGRYHLWFDVLVDTNYKGEKLDRPNRVMQSDDRVVTLFEGREA